METILFIDGENFRKKLEEVFDDRGKEVPDFSAYDFRGLFNKVLKGISLDREIFYFAKLKFDKRTSKKSKELIQKQRMLKTSLEQQGFEVVMAGRVRSQLEKISKGKEILKFKEKGVDVRMAVDMVTGACDRKLKIAIVGSSDSDLQPAIEEMYKRQVPEVIYLGFEINPNKGLTYTTKRTILIRNSEVIDFSSRKSN